MPSDAVTLDFETHLIEDRVWAPKPVCISSCGNDLQAGLYTAQPAMELFHQLLQEGKHLAFANIGFDISVQWFYHPESRPLIIEAADAGRLHDVQIREKLIDIATGEFRDESKERSKWKKRSYSVGAIVKRRLGVDMLKDALWHHPELGGHPVRTSYALLENTPMEDWPNLARVYAKEDALYQHKIFLMQEEQKEFLREEARLVRRAIVLYFMHRNGMPVDKEYVAAFRESKGDDYESVRDRLVAGGLYKMTNANQVAQLNLFTNQLVEPEYAKDISAVRERVIAAYNGDPPLTDKGGVRTDMAACKATGDPLLHDYAKSLSLEPYINKDLKYLIAGAETGSVHASFDNCVATTRTSCYNPNMQNLDDNVRRAFKAPDGEIFGELDVSAAELHTLAQDCLDTVGFSKLAELLNSGVDVHAMVAAIAHGRDYDWIVQENKRSKKSEGGQLRQMAKIDNYSYPGGGGWKAIRNLHLEAGNDLEPRGLALLSQATSFDVVDAYKYHEFVCKVQPQKEPLPVIEISDPGQAVLYWLETDAAGYYAKHLRELWLKALPEMRLFFKAVKAQMPTVTVNRSGFTRWTDRVTAAQNTRFQGAAALAISDGLWNVFKKIHYTKEMAGAKLRMFVHDSILATFPVEKGGEYLRLMKAAAEEGFNGMVPDVPTTLDGGLYERWQK